MSTCPAVCDLFRGAGGIIPNTHTVDGCRNNQPYVVDEGAGSIQVCVEVLEPGVPFGVDTRPATLDGTATAPEDYQQLSATLGFPLGDETTQCVNISVIEVETDDYSSLPLDCRLEPGDTTLEIVQDTAVVYIEDNDISLRYLPLGSNRVQTEDPSLDAISNEIQTLELPFGDTTHTSVYVFGEFDNVRFPHNRTRDLYLVAPFWEDFAINKGGDINYAVHECTSYDVTSIKLLHKVSSIVRHVESVNFHGSWMLVAMWDHIQPYGTNTATNTFQPIIITDGVSTFAVFMYKCGDLNWVRGGPTISYNTAGDYYKNHLSTLSLNADQELACRNVPASEYNNIVYNLSPLAAPSLPPLPERHWVFGLSTLSVKTLGE